MGLGWKLMGKLGWKICGKLGDRRRALLQARDLTGSRCGQTPGGAVALQGPLAGRQWLRG
jgi:hypothetical protein